MRFTEYGKKLAKEQPMFTTEKTGASAHAEACSYDCGTNIRLIGETREKRFYRSAKSVQGAHATAQACWGINSAWHIREDGTRKLIFRRY